MMIIKVSALNFEILVMMIMMLMMMAMMVMMMMIVVIIMMIRCRRYFIQIQATKRRASIHSEDIG